MRGLDEVRYELIQVNNQGKSWYRISIEIGVAPGTLLRFIDQWGPRGPHLTTAQKMAEYVGYEVAFTQSSVHNVVKMRKKR